MMNTAIMALAGVVADAAAADTGGRWRRVFEGQPGITSVGPVSRFPGVDLTRPLLNCPRLSPLRAEPVAAFNLKVDLGGRRRTDIDVWIAELPAGTRAYESVLAAGAGPVRSEWSCVLSKRGVSFVQVGRYWIGLPTLCRKGHYRGAVSVVLAALQRAHKEAFPSKFIFAPCGAMKVGATDTDELLNRAGRGTSSKAFDTDGASRGR